jgi:hypothetical protein
MSNAATDGGIYANGRTYAAHCAWLDSLVGDEYRIVHMPIGHLFNLAEISFLKYALLALEMTAGDRLKILNGIAERVHGSVTEEAVAAIEPCCEIGRKMFAEIHSLSVEKQTQAFDDGNVFRLLARLNPSLLTALRLCALGPIPEQPRNRVMETMT